MCNGECRRIRQSQRRKNDADTIYHDHTTHIHIRTHQSLKQQNKAGQKIAFMCLCVYRVDMHFILLSSQREEGKERDGNKWMRRLKDSRKIL